MPPTALSGAPGPVLVAGASIQCDHGRVTPRSTSTPREKPLAAPPAARLLQVVAGDGA